MIEVYFDGGRKVKSERSAAAAVVFRDGKEIAYRARYLPGKTNNEMEYAALKIGIEMVSKLGFVDVYFYGDSKLIVEQVKGNWKIKQVHLRPLRDEVVKLATERLKTGGINWIPREENARADEVYNWCIELEADMEHFAFDEEKPAR